MVKRHPGSTTSVEGTVVSLSHDLPWFQRHPVEVGSLSHYLPGVL